MIHRFALLAALLFACTPTASAPSPSPSGSSSSTPSVTATTSPVPTATGAAPPAVSPGTRAFVGAGLETFALGRLSGEVASVVRPGSGDGRELWAVPLDGRTGGLAARFRTPKVSNVNDANEVGRQLSPDGRRLVLSVGMGEIEVVSQLMIIELESGRVTPLFPGSTGSFDDSYPAWSPDGALIAFVRWPHAGGIDQREIWVVAPDGKDARRIRASQVRGTFVRLFGWLPDSRQIAFDPVNFEGSELAVVDLAGVERARRTERLNAVREGPMAISVRGQKPALAMAINDSPFQPTRYDLVVADDMAGAARVVATMKPDPATGQLGLAAPRWNPNGANQLLYRTTSSINETRLLDLDRDTTIEIGSRVKAAEWSPDGTKVVTIEEHPSTNSDTLYVFGRDGKLIASNIRLPVNDPPGFQLTDLAVRAY